MVTESESFSTGHRIKEKKEHEGLMSGDWKKCECRAVVFHSGINLCKVGINSNFMLKSTENIFSGGFQISRKRYGISIKFSFLPLFEKLKVRHQINEINSNVILHYLWIYFSRKNEKLEISIISCEKHSKNFLILLITFWLKISSYLILFAYFVCKITFRRYSPGFIRLIVF